MEKKFLLSYSPASLRKYPNRWTIEFRQLDPVKGILVRMSKTFNINRIKDKRTRLKRANELIKHLNEDLLPLGWPFVDCSDKSDPQEKVNLLDALSFAYQIKSRGKSEHSMKTYRNQYRTYTEWLMAKGYDMSVGDYSKRNAQLYIDHLQVILKLGPWSYNNHLGFVRSLFAILMDREYIFKNPFNGFPLEKKPESRFHVFSEEERKIVAQRIYEEDIWLFRGILLMYQCYIRKTELLRLRFNMFDFEKGIIKMPLGVVKKNQKINVRTIPNSIIKYFLGKDFRSQPGHYLVFGKGFKPHLNLTCSGNTPTYRHRKIVDQLEKEGKISNAKNLHLYGWKFTGITENLELMDIQHVSRQAGHSDMNITMGYRRAPEVNSHFKKLNIELL